MKILITIMILTILSGCKTLENYEFGDFSRKAIEKKKQYCSEENEAERDLILFAIHKFEPAWIPVCEIFEGDNTQPGDI